MAVERSGEREGRLQTVKEKGRGDEEEDAGGEAVLGVSGRMRQEQWQTRSERHEAKRSPLGITHCHANRINQLTNPPPLGHRTPAAAAAAHWRVRMRVAVVHG